MENSSVTDELLPARAVETLREMFIKRQYSDIVFRSSFLRSHLDVDNESEFYLIATAVSRESTARRERIGADAINVVVFGGTKPDESPGVNLLRNLVPECKHGASNTLVIFVSQNLPTSPALKVIRAPESDPAIGALYYLEHFCVDDLLFDITKSVYFDPVVRLHGAEYEAVVKRYAYPHPGNDFDIAKVTQADLVAVFPRYLSTDPIVRFFGFRPGDLIAILRRTGVQAETEYYRVVVEASKMK